MQKEASTCVDVFKKFLKWRWEGVFVHKVFSEYLFNDYKIIFSCYLLNVYVIMYGNGKILHLFQIYIRRCINIVNKSKYIIYEC